MWRSSNWFGHAHQCHIQMCSEKNGIFSLQKVNGSYKILQNLQLCFLLQEDSKTKGFEFLDEMRCIFVLLLVGLFSDLNSDQKPFKFSICLLVGSRYCGRLIKWIIRTPNISEAEICKQEWHYFVWYLKNWPMAFFRVTWKIWLKHVELHLMVSPNVHVLLIYSSANRKKSPISMK